MGVFDRLAKAVRDRQKVGNASDKPLVEMTDAELARELERRRRARGYKGGVEREDAAPGDGSETIPGWKAREWLRALELPPRSTREDVEAAYARLAERYDPEKYKQDPEKHRDAQRVMDRLREAYLGLKRYFEG